MTIAERLNGEIPFFFTPEMTMKMPHQNLTFNSGRRFEIFQLN